MKIIHLLTIVSLLSVNILAQENTLITLSQFGTQNTGDKIESADFDNDGNLDLVLFNFSGLLLYSIGDYVENSWVPQVITPLFTASPLNLEVADLDMDEDIDIAFADGSQLYIFLNGGNANFEQVIVNTGLGESYLMRDLGIGDIDNDGDPDITLAMDSTMIWVENIDNWTSHQINFIETEGLAFRGAQVLDWELDGDLDIITMSGGFGLPMILYTQDNGVWTSSPLVGSDGGVLSFDVADIDNDGDLDIGTGNNASIVFTDTGTGESQIVDFSNGLAEGGHFVDLDNDGSPEWVQLGWPDGDLVCVDFDNGSPSSPIQTGFVVPNCDDVFFLDGDGNGEEDMFFSTYYGEITLGVIPDYNFDVEHIGISGVSEVDEQLIVFQTKSEISYRIENQTEILSARIVDLQGKLVSKVENNSFEGNFSITELASGVYILQIELSGMVISRKFVI